MFKDGNRKNVGRGLAPAAHVSFIVASGGCLSCSGKKDTKEPAWAASLPAAGGGRREGVACAAVGREQARFVGRSYRRVPQTGSAELILPQGKPPPQDPTRRAFSLVIAIFQFFNNNCQLSIQYAIFLKTERKYFYEHKFFRHDRNQRPHRCH